MNLTKQEKIYPNIIQLIDQLRSESAIISAERKEVLHRLADYISGKVKEGTPIQLNFICTHNSRRSHLGQIWAACAATYFGIDSIETFSGGTEATAFNPRAVAALERVGFQIINPGGENPHYQVSFGQDAPTLECFSKVYDDPFNPKKDFAAIMTCSDADENCPFIPGASFRLSLTYEDPKVADNTPEESAKYDERVQQIGRELLYAMGLVK